MMGKLSYGFRKVTCSKDAPPECAACEITHGGLSLKETPAWQSAKATIESSGQLSVVQWHRDEMDDSLKSWFKSESLSYPAAILKKDEKYELVMNRDQLAECKGQPDQFVEKLKGKGIISWSLIVSLNIRDQIAH